MFNNLISKLLQTKHEVEEELTSLFPTRLIDLYEFLYSMGISMDSLGLRRYTTTQSTFYSIN